MQIIEPAGNPAKEAWGPGPWQEEPDKVQWYDEATGLPCMVIRQMESGHLCGYVGVYEGHPLHRVDCGAECEALAKARDERLERPIGDQPGMGVLLSCLTGEMKPRPDCVFEVHGGLTFSGECAGRICHVPRDGEPHPVWWFGFDCAHSGDLQPARQAMFSWDYGAKYADISYVQAQCASLAAQLAAVSTEEHEALAEEDPEGDPASFGPISSPEVIARSDGDR